MKSTRKILLLVFATHLKKICLNCCRVLIVGLVLPHASVLPNGADVLEDDSDIMEKPLCNLQTLFIVLH